MPTSVIYEQLIDALSFSGVGVTIDAFPDNPICPICVSTGPPRSYDPDRVARRCLAKRGWDAAFSAGPAMFVLDDVAIDVGGAIDGNVGHLWTSC
jgi:hypothetical protein